MIKPTTFKSQTELLKWLRRGGVKWTKKQLLDNLPTFSTDWDGSHVHVIRIRTREYFVSNYGGKE
jgi:hypothetical protein